MMIFASSRAVRKKFPEGEQATGERDVLPGDFLLRDQPDLQALGAGGENRLEEPRPEHHMDLVGMRDADNGEERAHLDGCQGFFMAFARRGRLQCLAVFHESRRCRPVTAPWFDGATADEDPVFPLRYAAQDQQRVPIVDGPAVLAHETRQMIARRSLEDDGRGAVAAKIQSELGDDMGGLQITRSLACRTTTMGGCGWTRPPVDQARCACANTRGLAHDHARAMTL